jgi:hypothetical protein
LKDGEWAKANEIGDRFDWEKKKKKSKIIRVEERKELANE